VDPPGDEALRLETIDEARNARVIGQKELGELRRSGAALPVRPDDELRLLHREPERLHLAIDDRTQLTCDADEKAADPLPRRSEAYRLPHHPALNGHGARLDSRDNTCQDKQLVEDLATPARERVAAWVPRGVLQLVLDLHQAVVLRIALAA